MTNTPPRGTSPPEIPPELPLEDFFRKPDKVFLRLSPDGSHLAWLAPWRRRLNVFVRNLSTGVETRVTSATERDIGGFAWVSDARLVYAQDKGGDENDRLFAVGRDGSNPRDLTPFDNVKCSLVDDLEDEDDLVLFQMNRRDPQRFDVYRLDTRTGDMSMVAENPGTIQTWVTDHRGRVRAATTTDGVSTSLLFRDDESEPFRTVATYDFKENASPLFFTFDDQRLYVSSNVGRDRAAVFEYDPAAGKETSLVFEHAQVDVDRLLLSKKRKVITGAAFETDRVRYQFFDDRRASIQRFLDERMPGYENALAHHDRDETKYVVHSGSDRTRGSYHLLELRDGGESFELTRLFDLSPWLDADAMAEMTPIEVTSRDGLHMHGYLTLPKGREPKELPLVMHPHGGRWARDSWGFNPTVQFLANRGYAILQINFRGSTGYGRAFLEASFAQWGLAMQDDVTDAVRWAIDQGVADPQRVAIFGASYGGYATLAGLTRTPDLYACGVSYVGVSNLFTWMEAIPPYWKPYLEMMHEMVGHPERDRDRFEATSPFFNAHKITAPLLVAQGANDPRVRKEESDQIVQAMRERGIDVEYIVKDDEGHGFRNEENTFEFHRALEAFLDRHLQHTG